MNLNLDKKNSHPEKLKSYKLKIFRFFSKNLPPSRGFTLVELLVTLSLFVVLTTIVLFSQQKFNGSILLTNLAYDVALTVRQAQSYGVNVRETSGGSFEKAYGVHFDTSSAKNTKFLLFSDSVGLGNDGVYNGSWTCNSGGDECLNSYSIKRGNYISDIKVTSSDCAPDLSPCSAKELDITFLRPDPDAKFKAKKSNGGGNVNNITEATIILSSASGDARNVLVNSTGQISVGRGGSSSNNDFKLIGVATCDHSGSTENVLYYGTWSPKNTQFDLYHGLTYNESTCGGHVPQKHKVYGQSPPPSCGNGTASWYAMCVQNFTSCGNLGLLDAGTNSCKHNDGVYP